MFLALGSCLFWNIFSRSTLGGDFFVSLRILLHHFGWRIRRSCLSIYGELKRLKEYFPVLFVATISNRRRSHTCRRNEWVRTEWVIVTKEFWYRLIFHSLCNLNILICIFTDFTEALCVCLGFLWLDVKIDKKKTIVIFFIPDNEISNSIKVFLLLRAVRRAVTLFLTGFQCSARTVLGTSGHFCIRAILRSHEWARDDPLNTKYVEVSGNTYCKQRQNCKFHVTSRASIHQGDNRLSDVFRGRQCRHWGNPIKRSTFWGTNKLLVAYEGD